MVFGFTSCSLCLPELFTYPIFRPPTAMRATPKTLLPKSVQDVGKKTCRWLLLAPNATLHIHSFEILDKFLTCISRGAVASRRFWFRWGDFIPLKTGGGIPAVFCADASRFVGQKFVWNGLPQKGSARNQEDDVIPILLYTSKTVRLCIIEGHFIFTTIHFQRQTLQIPAECHQWHQHLPAAPLAYQQSHSKVWNKKGKKRPNNFGGNHRKKTHLSTLSEVSSKKVKLLHLRVVWLFFDDFFSRCSGLATVERFRTTRISRRARNSWGPLFVILGTFFGGDGFAGCCAPILPKCFYICQNPEWEVTPPGFPQIVQNCGY